jgi:hypothetical protein
MIGHLYDCPAREHGDARCNCEPKPSRQAVALDMQGHHDVGGPDLPAVAPSPLAHVWADVLRWSLAEEELPVVGAAIRRHYERDLQRLDQAIRADERQRLIADDEAHMSQGRTE